MTQKIPFKCGSTFYRFLPISSSRHYHFLFSSQDLLDQPAYARNYQTKKCKLSHFGAGRRHQDQDQGVDFKLITIVALSSLLLISIILALFWVCKKSKRQVEDRHTQTDVKNEGLNDTYDTTYGRTQYLTYIIY